MGPGRDRPCDPWICSHVTVCVTSYAFNWLLVRIFFPNSRVCQSLCVGEQDNPAHASVRVCVIIDAYNYVCDKYCVDILTEKNSLWQKSIHLRINSIFGMFMESGILRVSCKVSIHDSMNIPKIGCIAYINILFFVWFDSLRPINNLSVM